jgi:hypothetical protein
MDLATATTATTTTTKRSTGSVNACLASLEVHMFRQKCRVKKC